jgi:hypothetical protein
MIDQVISDGRYRVGRLVARGGMAHVRLGLDVQSGRAVAVKYLLAEYLDNQDARRLFQAEAATVRPDHPAIVRVLDSGEVLDDTGASVPYLVMDFVPGSTLRALLRDDAIGLDRALDLAVQLLGALGSCHAAGLVHRDVKPGNVMVTPAGRVHLVDFGVARHCGGAPESADDVSYFVSTAYASPEQVQRLPADGRSDLYSVGCVLYEMLTGRPPFSGSPRDVLIERLFADPQPPSVHDDAIGPDLDAVVLRSLRRYPVERYATAEAMSQDLEEIIRSRRRPHMLPPVSSVVPDAAGAGWAPVTVLRPPRRTPRRRTLSVISGAAAALLPIAGFGMLHLRGAEVADGGALAASLMTGSGSSVAQRSTPAGPVVGSGAGAVSATGCLLGGAAAAAAPPSLVVASSARGAVGATGAAARLSSQKSAGPGSASGASDQRPSAKPDKPKPDKPKSDKPKSDKPKPTAPKPDKPKPDKPKPTAPKPDKPKPTAPKPTAPKPKPDKPKPDKPKPDKPKPDKPRSKPPAPKPSKPKPSKPKPDKPKPSKAKAPKPDKPEPDKPKPDKPGKPAPKGSTGR